MSSSHWRVGHQGGAGFRMTVLALSFRMNPLGSTATVKCIWGKPRTASLSVAWGHCMSVRNVLIQHTSMSIVARSRNPPWWRGAVQTDGSSITILGFFVVSADLGVLIFPSGGTCMCRKAYWMGKGLAVRGSRGSLWSQSVMRSLVIGSRSHWNTLKGGNTSSKILKTTVQAALPC